MRTGDWLDVCVVWKLCGLSVSAGWHLRDESPMCFRQVAKD